MADDGRRDPQEEYESNAARRMRAQGQDDEEIDAIHEGEQATGSWFANFWYHHKWKVIVGGAFLFILITGCCRYTHNHVQCLITHTLDAVLSSEIN